MEEENLELLSVPARLGPNGLIQILPLMTYDSYHFPFTILSSAHLPTFVWTRPFPPLTNNAFAFPGLVDGSASGKEFESIYAQLEQQWRLSFHCSAYQQSSNLTTAGSGHLTCKLAPVSPRLFIVSDTPGEADCLFAAQWPIFNSAPSTIPPYQAASKRAIRSRCSLHLIQQCSALPTQRHRRCSMRSAHEGCSSRCVGLQADICERRAFKQFR